jgi:hypothetical protein
MIVRYHTHCICALYDTVSIPSLPGAGGAGGESHLQGEKRERLMKLAAAVAAEQDPKKFRALLVKLNQLLEEKERRLQSRGNPTGKPNFQVNSKLRNRRTG